jgi:hypothetical protein
MHTSATASAAGNTISSSSASRRFLGMLQPHAISWFLPGTLGSATHAVCYPRREQLAWESVPGHASCVPHKPSPHQAGLKGALQLLRRDMAVLPCHIHVHALTVEAYQVLSINYKKSCFEFLRVFLSPFSRPLIRGRYTGVNFCREGLVFLSCYCVSDQNSHPYGSTARTSEL